MQSRTPTPCHDNITQHTTPIMLNSTSATAASSSADAAAVDDYDSDGKAEPEESDDLVVSSDDNDNNGNDDNIDDDVHKDVFFSRRPGHPEPDVSKRWDSRHGGPPLPRALWGKYRHRPPSLAHDG